MCLPKDGKELEVLNTSLLVHILTITFSACSLYEMFKQLILRKDWPEISQPHQKIKCTISHWYQSILTEQHHFTPTSWFCELGKEYSSHARLEYQVWIKGLIISWIFLTVKIKTLAHKILILKGGWVKNLTEITTPTILCTAMIIIAREHWPVVALPPYLWRTY